MSGRWGTGFNESKQFIQAIQKSGEEGGKIVAQRQLKKHFSVFKVSVSWAPLFLDE